MEAENLVVHNDARVNKALKEAIEVIRRNNPEYDCNPPKISSLIRSTQYPNGIKVVHKQYLNASHYLKQLRLYKKEVIKEVIKKSTEYLFKISHIRSTQYPNGKKVDYK